MLEFHNLSVAIEKKTILQQINATVREQRLTVLVGPNGCGKSTLLSCVNQQRDYTGDITYGKARLNRLSPRERARKLAYLPQKVETPHISVAEYVALGRMPFLDFTGRLSEQDREIIHQAMMDADVISIQNQYVNSISGGELQRVNLAMILAQNVPMALLDEPTAHLDQCREEAYLQLLRELIQNRQKTFLVVMHNLSTALTYADDLMVMNQGRLLYTGPKDICLQSSLLEDVFGLRRYTAENNKVFFAAESSGTEKSGQDFNDR